MAGQGRQAGRGGPVCLHTCSVLIPWRSPMCFCISYDPPQMALGREAVVEVVCLEDMPFSQQLQVRGPRTT